jgi:hypothetical protein
VSVNGEQQQMVSCIDCGASIEPPKWGWPARCSSCEMRCFNLGEQIAAHLRQAYPSLDGRAANAITSNLVTFSSMPLADITAGSVVASVASLSDGEILCWKNVGRKTLAEIRTAIPKALGANSLGCPFCGHELPGLKE